MAPATPTITAQAVGSIGEPLTLTCLSANGYPQQTVEWYRGTVTDNIRLVGNVTVVQDGLFNVTNTLTFTTTSSDNGVKFLCQSAYTGEPQLIRQADVVLGIISINYGCSLKYMCTFDLGILSVALT